MAGVPEDFLIDRLDHICSIYAIRVHGNDVLIELSDPADKDLFNNIAFIPYLRKTYQVHGAEEREVPEALNSTSRRLIVRNVPNRISDKELYMFFGHMASVRGIHEVFQPNQAPTHTRKVILELKTSEDAKLILRSDVFIDRNKMTIRWLVPDEPLRSLIEGDPVDAIRASDAVSASTSFVSTDSQAIQFSTPGSFLKADDEDEEFLKSFMASER